MSTRRIPPAKSQPALFKELATQVGAQAFIFARDRAPKVRAISRAFNPRMHPYGEVRKFGRATQLPKDFGTLSSGSPKLGVNQLSAVDQILVDRLINVVPPFAGTVKAAIGHVATALSGDAANKRRHSELAIEAFKGIAERAGLGELPDGLLETTVREVIANLQVQFAALPGAGLGDR